MNARTARLLAALALGGLAAAAAADVDAEIVGNAKIRGTLAPEGEVEVMRFDATAGSLLTLGLVAKKKAPLDFTIALFAPDGSEISFDTAARVIDKDKKIAVKKLPLEQSGSYRLQVTATGTGEYALKVKSAPAKRISRTLALDGGASGAAGIAAPAGSKVTIRATAPKGEVVLPRVDAIGGIDVDGLPGPKGSVHTVSVVLGPDDGGDLAISLTNTADATGMVAIQATVKPPKVKVVKLDVRGAARGSPTGGETVVVRAVGAEGGVVSVDDADSRIDGVSVEIPPGALVDPAAISVSTADRIALPGGDGVQAAGEAVEFGPDGLQFGVPATVVIPVDPTSLPIDADEDDVRVVRLSSDGETEIIVPTSVDLETGTVTAPTSGFSTFMAIVPRGSPDLTGSEYWFIGFSIGLSPDPQGGFDSRARDVDLSIGTMAFGDRGVTGDVVVSSEFRDVTWIHDQDGRGSFPVQDFGGGVELGTWDYEPGGQDIALDVGDEEDGPGVLVVSEDGSFLLGGGGDPGDAGEVSLGLAVRKAPGQTLANLAGTYHFAAGEYVASQHVADGPLDVELLRYFGAFSVRTDGTWTLQGTEHISEFGNPGGFQFERESFRESGTARIGTTADGLFEGALIFETAPDPEDQETDTFVALPGADGRVLIGADLFPLNDGQLILIAVRQGRDVSRSVLDGVYRTVSLEVEPETYTTQSGAGVAIDIGDYSVCGYETVLDFDGRGRATELFYTGACFRRDAGEPSGIFTIAGSGVDEGDSFSVKVASDGKLTEPGNNEPFVGAVTDDGTFYFSIDDPKGPAKIYGFEVGVRPPPLQLD